MVAQTPVRVWQEPISNFDFYHISNFQSACGKNLSHQFLFESFLSPYGHGVLHKPVTQFFHFCRIELAVVFKTLSHFPKLEQHEARIEALNRKKGENFSSLAWRGGPDPEVMKG